MKLLRPARIIVFCSSAIVACSASSRESSAGDEAPLSAVDLPVDPADVTFAAAQNTRTRSYLATNAALQTAVKARYAELAPQNARVKASFFDMDFYVSKGSLFLGGVGGAQDRLLVDATRLPPGSVVTEYRPSPDKTKLAFGYAGNGNDWTTWRVIALDDLRELAGPFAIKSSGVDEMNWDPDSLGLFYPGWLTAADDEVGIRRPQIRYHRLGEAIERDTVVFDDESSPHTIRYQAWPVDARTVVVFRNLGAAEIPIALYIAKKRLDGTWQKTPVLLPHDSWGRFVGVDGRKLLIRSSRAGDRYGILACDLDAAKDGAARWETIVPEHETDVLTQAQQIGNRLVLQYFDRQLGNRIVVTDTKGALQRSFSPHEVGLSDQGAFSLLTGNAQSTRSWFTFQSLTTPLVTLSFDVGTSAIDLIASPPTNFDGAKVKLDSLSFNASDGTSIPIDVYSRTDTTTPPRFVYLYFYGNIGVPNTPTFNRKFQLMLEMGAVVALPHLRGGGEYGLAWQQAGIFDKPKQLRDIAAASRWLKARYPSAEGRVVLAGRSYGGMMTMAEYVHHQDDFSLFVPVVGISDPWAMLTRERGWVYFDDLGFHRDAAGQLVSQAEAERTIHEWSPFENRERVVTPKPIIAFAAQFDARVSASQTIRFVRALQDRFGETAPVYLLQHENVGHNGRAEAPDEAMFVANQFDVKALSPLVR